MPLGALEDVDARLVLERDRGLGVDRQAVAPVVEAVVEDEAAHGQVVDVARAVVRVADRGVEADQVGEAARPAVADLAGADGGGGYGRFGERYAGPAGDAGVYRCVAGDANRGEGGGAAWRVRAGAPARTRGGFDLGGGLRPGIAAARAAAKRPCRGRCRRGERDSCRGCHRLLSMAGRRGRPQDRRADPLSLREDYLNQVRRDFLSRNGERPTPPADASRPEPRRRADYAGPVEVPSGATPSSLCSFGLVVV